MNKIDSAEMVKSNPVVLSHELHAIAARLAGVEEILRELVESPEGRGNTLYLLAEAVANANDQISNAADRVSDLHTVEDAQ